MKCLRCGTESADTLRFCTTCGATLPRVCPDCGVISEPMSRFCGGCGKALDATTTSRSTASDKIGLTAHTRAVEAERRQLTVMFCDMVDSTKLAQQLDPEVMLEHIGFYHRLSTHEIERFGGFVAKYMGDGVLAYFGYPQAHEDDAARALHAALGVVNANRSQSAEPGRADNVEFAVRVGIATGPVVVGEMVGAGQSEEVSVVGTTPNLAARLQEIAGPNGIVVAAETRRLAGETFAYEDLGLRRLKGLVDPVATFRLLGSRDTSSRFEARQAGKFTPFVGRGQELAHLLEGWESAKAGAARVVVVSGDPGIGKSRLVQALREAVAGEPHLQLRLQCSPHHTNSALYPHIELLEREAGFQRGDPPTDRLDKLERLLATAGPVEPGHVALLALLLSIPSGDRYPSLALSPPMQKQQTFDVLTAHVTDLSRRQPVLLLYEDVHWIDPTSQELLDLIVRRLAGEAVMTVITTRQGGVSTWADLSYVTSLGLARLSQQDATMMARHLVSDLVLSSTSVANIVARTDGVPLFIEELTAMLAEAGTLGSAGGVVTETEVASLLIPMTLQDLLMERLDRLSIAKRAAQIGAAIGREFSFELLAAVAETDEVVLRSALNRLVQSGLVMHRSNGDESYRFKHALVQEAAYNSMLLRLRRRLHSGLADALSSRFPELVTAQPETIARHLTGAERWAQASTHWLAAGQLALRRGAPREAITHFTEGLTVVARMPAGTERIRSELALQAVLGPTLKVTKGPGHPDFGRVQAAALELCHQLEDRPGLFPITFSLCLYHWACGELAKAESLATELLAMAEASGTDEQLMNAEMMTSMIRLHRGDPLDASQRLERAIAVYDSDQHQDLYPTYQLDVGVFGRFYLALALSVQGNIDRAAELAEAAVGLARVLRQPHSYGFALLANFITRTWWRDSGAVLTFTSECIAFSSEQGFPEFVALARICRGYARLRQGETQEGILEIEEGIDLWRATGFETWQSWYSAMLAEGMIMIGRADEALIEVDRQLARIEENDEQLFKSLLLATRAGAVAALQPTKAPEVEGLYCDALEVAHRQKALLWELRIGLEYVGWLSAQGRVEAGQSRLASILCGFTEGFASSDVVAAAALLASTDWSPVDRQTRADR
jgi:class 3 adenylate cyclase/tetratricopeptide (TPR) repeat protein